MPQSSRGGEAESDLAGRGIMKRGERQRSNQRPPCVSELHLVWAGTGIDARKREIEEAFGGVQVKGLL